MSRKENPGPDDGNRPEFRLALTLFAGLCGVLLLLHFGISGDASILGWEVGRRITLGELLIAFLTLSYVIVSTAQWSAMHSMSRTSQESNILTLRALAVVHDFQFRLVATHVIRLRVV